MNLKEQKNAIRSTIRDRISGMTPNERRYEDAAVCQILQGTLHHSRTVCAYAPLPDELNILPLLHWLAGRETAIFLPRYERDRLTFHRVKDLAELAPGAFAIAEPKPHHPSPDPAEISHVLVPGRAFDLLGNRLGRGKGCYDSWIAAQRKVNRETQFLGIAYGCQIVDHLPVEDHDEKMDKMITGQ